MRKRIGELRGSHDDVPIAVCHSREQAEVTTGRERGLSWMHAAARRKRRNGVGSRNSATSHLGVGEGGF